MVGGFSPLKLACSARLPDLSRPRLVSSVADLPRSEHLLRRRKLVLLVSLLRRTHAFRRNLLKSSDPCRLATHRARQFKGWPITFTVAFRLYCPMCRAAGAYLEAVFVRGQQRQAVHGRRHHRGDDPLRVRIYFLHRSGDPSTPRSMPYLYYKFIYLFLASEKKKRKSSCKSSSVCHPLPLFLRHKKGVNLVPLV